MKSFEKTKKIFCYEISFSFRSKNQNMLGRFGGGWNWKIGVQIGESTILISLLIFELSIRKTKEKHHEV